METSHFSTFQRRPVPINIDDHANSIAAAAAPKVGLAIGMVVEIAIKLIPLLVDAFNLCSQNPAAAAIGDGQVDDTSSATRFLNRRWNDRRQHYKGHLVERMRDKTKSAAQSAGQILTDAQADEMTIASFDHIRSLDEPTVAAAMASFSGS